MPRQQGSQDAEGIGIEVVHREVRLPARVAAADPLEGPCARRPVVVPQDMVAEFAAGLAQAGALAEPDEQTRDLLVPEHEPAPGADAFVALEDVLAVRARSPRVGVAVGRLADGDREREGVPLRPRHRYAAVARSPVGIAPAGCREAVEQDSAARVGRALGPKGRTVEERASHAPRLSSRRATYDGTRVGSAAASHANTTGGDADPVAEPLSACVHRTPGTPVE